MDLLTAKATAYLDLAEAHAALATNRETPAGKRRAQWQTARQFYLKGLDILLDMKTKGTLRSTEESTIAAMKRELARCDAALRKRKVA